ncbi:MAG: hypothetical protein KBT20_07965 [Bacteroidales bacterium]|nr:hypothetical protein [Candidatus Liminaster caballi]
MKNIEDIKFDGKKRSQAGMTVPEGFFEQFQLNLEAEIDRLEAQKSPQIGKRQEEASQPMIGQKKSNAHRWAIAASVALLIGVGLSLYKYDGQTTAAPEENFASYDEEIVTDTDQMLLGSLSEYDLYEMYCESF